MKLSVPIYRLKRQAKAISRQESIPLNEALDQVAVEEGFKSWSLLAIKAKQINPASQLFSRFNPGDMVLLGGPRNHGKTQLGLELIAEGLKSGCRGVFFTLEFGDKEVLDRIQAIVGELSNNLTKFEFDTSDNICADYIIERLDTAPRGTVVVIDYLQLLDQKRENPELKDQVHALKRLANERGLIVVFLSQISRLYDSSSTPFPGLGDVRLPNPVDLSLFNQRCFLSDGELQAEAIA